MQSEVVHSLTETFEGHAQQTETGVEYWLARDLQHLLGYAEWRNFGSVITRAKTACEVSGHPVADHFVGVTKMVETGNEATTSRSCRRAHERSVHLGQDNTHKRRGGPDREKHHPER